VHANDAALVAHSETHLQNLCDCFTKACTDFSIITSLKKTDVMLLGTPNSPHILINSSLLKTVDKFSYLGCVNFSKSRDDRINQQVGKALANFRSLSSRVWNNHPLTIKLKVRVYFACVLSILLYSSKMWYTYNRQKTVSTLHFRFLHPILGVSWRDPVRHLLTWPHHHHEAVTSVLAGAHPSYGVWLPAQGYPLQRILQHPLENWQTSCSTRTSGMA